MQTGLQIKLSDQHPAGKRSWLLTAEIVYGAELCDGTRVAKIQEI